MTRIVVKIGSSLLTNDGQGLDTAAMEDWAGQISANVKCGHRVVLVSSGAIVEGIRRLGWKRRPDTLHELQAAAAVGQVGLIRAWEGGFPPRGAHRRAAIVHP